MLILCSELLNEIRAHAQECYPQEACGLLVGDVKASVRRTSLIRRARNLEVERASDRYELDPQDYYAADELARASGLEVIGIYHSHPDHPARPSRTDLERAWEGWSYLILSIENGALKAFHSFEKVRDAFLEEQVCSCTERVSRSEARR